MNVQDDCQTMQPRRRRPRLLRYALAAGAYASLLCGCGHDALGGDPQVELIAEVLGVTSYEWSGLSLGSAGDVNADGAADVQISSLAVEQGGRTSVFFGPLKGRFETSQADVAIRGEVAFSNAGQSVTEAGGCDFDGDKIADLLIGAPFADRSDVQVSPALSGDNNGRAYLIYGHAGLADRTLASADHVFWGEHSYDAAGTSVACLGDIDGDGYDDIAIGAPRRASGELPGAGAVYVYYGRPRGGLERQLGLERADFVLQGEGPHDGAGTFIGRIGDHDSDGRADFLVGAPGSDQGGPDSGAVYLVLSGPTRWHGAYPLAQAEHVLFGQFGQRLGMSASRAGDFDGDGREDLLLGTSAVASAQEAPGVAYLVSGQHRHGRFAAANVSVILRGALAGDGCGIGVGAIPDLNGDRQAELLLGAPLGTGEEASAGIAYLVRGRAVEFPSTINLQDEAVILRGRHRGDALGEHVRAVGDLDQDGVPDVAISARAQATTQAGGGAVYIVSGKRLGGR